MVPQQKKTILKGYIDHVSPHIAYLITDQKEIDLIIPWKHLMGAMHQDFVEAIPTKKNTKSGRMEARVVRILSRTQTHLVGIPIKRNNQWELLPSAKKMHYPLLLLELSSPNEKEKIYAKITEYPTLETKGKAIFLRSLGNIGSYEAETASLMEEFRLKDHFPKAVEEEVKKIAEGLSPKEIEGRKDFRGIPTFTIDPKDAKDFDDAVSFKTLSPNCYEIGVHIADVTHYVEEGTALDKEAYKRGNSTYLIGKCISMLPEKLSNELCSLQPHVDRPAFSLIFQINQEGEVLQFHLCESIIHSCHRFTYEEAQEVIDKKEGPFAKELLLLHQLTEKMRKERAKQGAILFTSSDIAIELDSANLPIHIRQKKTLSTHHLIEELALLTNRTIAKEAYKHHTHQGHPFLYREHAAPDLEKIEQFISFLKSIGLSNSFSPKKIGYFYQEVMNATEHTPLAHMIQTMAIRTMSQARYSTSIPAHFGLGFSHYTHFTSPIRRYADLIVHRLLKKSLAGNKEKTKNLPLYNEIAAQVSLCEQAAKEAERASINYTQARFMQSKKGKSFDALITGLTEWGLYAEIIPYKCEGMIRLVDMQGDYYYLDNKKFTLRGSRTKKEFKLGDSIRVQVKNCNLTKRTIDLIWIPIKTNA